MSGDLNWQLRSATDADREFLFELHRAALGPYIDETWGWEEAWQRERFDFNFPSANWQVIVVDGAPVGSLRTAEGDQVVQLNDIEILPSFQRRGLGTSIIRSLIRKGGEAGKDVALQVLKVNPARNLYQRLGFRETGEDEFHIKMRYSANR